MASGDDFLKAIGVEVWKLRDQNTQADPDQAELPGPPQAAMGSDTVRIADIGTMDVRALQVAVAGCQRCQLSKTRTNTVFGAGSLDADLLFIGEGPGHQEDLQGLPFVGRAGKLLTAMIAAVGFERDQVYIANVVKCRPPNNRDPLSDEASACSHYLRRQIEIIRPKVIVALGRVSAQLLLDTDAPLRELRGKPQKYRDTDVDVVVTYHPAYLLRKATEKRKSWDDLWKVRLMLNQS